MLAYKCYNWIIEKRGDMVERMEMLKKVAEKALAEYDIKVNELEFLAEETNVHFKIRTSDDEKFALKIFQEESSDINDNRAEVFFLSHLKDIETPYVLMNKAGEGVTIVRSELTEKPKRVTVYSWMEGEDIDGKETPEVFQELGRLTATLHSKTAAIKIPEDINPKRWDKVFYYPDEEAVYHEELYQDLLAEDTVEIMDTIIPILNERLSDLYNGQEPQLIHADLNPWNVKIHKDGLRVLDFEEAMYGFPVHDLAITFFYYRNDKNFNFDEVKAAVIKGYNEIYPEMTFDDDVLEMLMIARRVNFLNYCLYIDDADKEYVTRCTEIIKEYLANLK